MMHHKTGLKVFLISLVVFLQATALSAAIAEVEEIQVIVTTTELVVGTNRFAFGILKAGKLVEVAEVRLRLYSIDGSEMKLVSELEIPYQTTSKAERERAGRRHADGPAIVHGDDSSVRGVYVTQLSFSRSGDWGIELVIAQSEQPVEIVRFGVTVNDSPGTTAISSATPRSRMLITDKMETFREIDFASIADARLHQGRIADAIAQPKPQLASSPRTISIVKSTSSQFAHRLCLLS